MNIIVLEHPRIPSEKWFNDIANTPLWSCLMSGYAASSLSSAGFKPFFLDHARPGNRFEDTREEIRIRRPDLLCINAVYFWEHTHKLFDFISEIQGFCGHINLFGFMPSLVYRRILSGVDSVYSVCVGEFEHTLVELARALETGDTLAGFESLLMGVESGSTNVLSRIDKSSGPKQASGAITLCRKYGIEPEIGFLMFVPDSRLQELRRNMAFLENNKLLDRLDRTANLLSHTRIVLAGTTGCHRFEQKGLLMKIGVFGFEGEVRFSDPAVAWVARLLTFACHFVLRSMSDKASPIYWEKEETPVFKTVNNYLIDLCYELLDLAESEDCDVSPSGIESKEHDIKSEIKAFLNVT